MDKDTRVNVVQLRRLFDSLPKTVQKRELSRLQRVFLDKPAIMAIDPRTDEKYQFNTVNDLMKWLRANGHPNANNSNVYKSLNNSRPTAYGYKIKYKREDEK